MDKRYADFEEIWELLAFYVRKLTPKTASKLTTAYSDYARAWLVLGEKEAEFKKAREEALKELEGLEPDYRKRVGG